MIQQSCGYLDVSQPTITLRIKELEKGIGGYLFIRVGKQMELTDIGKGFLPYARQALEILNKGKERAQSIKEGIRGEITIGTLPTFTTGLFSTVIIDMHKRFPEIDLTIHTGHNQQIIEMLYDGFVKLGCITSPFFNRDLKKLDLIKEPLILVAHRNHLLSKKKGGTYTVEEVFANSSPYILTDWSEEAKHWQRSNMNFGLDTLELPPATALEYVLNGQGITLLTESMVSKHIEDGTLVKINPKNLPALYREIALVSLEHKNSLPSAAQNFLRTLRTNHSNFINYHPEESC
ncbi:LysR family transcriptional regulator [Bacillus salacetis]|uniref:LysR family transcriptional regulator n=1 Tax=Bacillus salacetis TaxID=2315464 RepID=UPI003B9EE185